MHPSVQLPASSKSKIRGQKPQHRRLRTETGALRCRYRLAELRLESAFERKIFKDIRQDVEAEDGASHHRDSTTVSRGMWRCGSPKKSRHAHRKV